MTHTSHPLPLFLFALLTGTVTPAVSAPGEPPSGPAPLRHYTFDAMRDAATPVPGGSAPDTALRFDPGPEAQAFQTVPGRRPGGRAVRMDGASLSGTPFPIGRAFTVAVWVRAQGQGRERGNSGTPNGTLIAAGNGYWEGWRLTVTNPTGTVAFEIGQPQPSHSVLISGGALATGAWQQVAASWDGREMRLYLDGLPVAHGPYTGVYTPPTGPLRIGFADSGVGSEQMDVDEVTAYDDAEDPVTVLEQAHAPARLTGAARDAFRQALTARDRGELPSAITLFRRLTQRSDVAPAYRASARLALAEALEGRQEPNLAAAEYARLVEGTDVPGAERGAAQAALLNLIALGTAGDLPPRLFERLVTAPGVAPEQRTAALFGLARSLRQSHAPRLAVTQYDRLLVMPGLSPEDHWNAAMGRVTALAEAGDWAAAHTAARGLTQAASYVRSIALLTVAHAAVQARQDTVAQSIFREVLALPAAPPDQVWEARQGLRAAGPTRVLLPPTPKPALRLYVAPNGSDANPGTLTRPFATLAHARDVLRARRQTRGLPPGGAAVVLRGGAYALKDSFALTGMDSGTAASPIVYMAADGETPVLMGATRLHGFHPVTDPALLARLPASARGHVVQVDLRANGVTDFGRFQPHGYGQNAVPIPELFFNGRPLTPARWPNKGFVLTGPVTDNDSSAQSGFTFGYSGDEPARWGNEQDAWLYGYWYWDWADANIPVASVDPARHTIHTTITPPMGARTGQRFYAYNVLAELDTPGEWYLDREHGLLLFYPPGPPAGADVEYTRLDTPLITLDGVSHVTLRGLGLEGGRATGISARSSDHCLIAACTVRRCGGDGVIVDGGGSDGVFGCDLYTLGRGGVRVTGGDRKTLTPSGDFVENCDIHDFSRLDRTYTPAVYLDGDGIRITHNRLHDAPHHAIRMEGNDHVIEYNEVYDVVREADDQGGLDVWRDPTYRGNILRYNYWHDIGSGLTAVGQAGIRLDDAISGTLIYGNIFQRCSGGHFGGVQINGGRDNVIDNNLFLDCPIAISGGPWDPGHWTQYLAQPDIVNLTTNVVDIRRPPYSTRYPDLAHLGDTHAVNNVWRNMVSNCGRFLANGPDRQTLADNDFAAATNLSDATRLAARDGFAPIPLAEIGLYPDRNRASWVTERNSR